MSARSSGCPCRPGRSRSLAPGASAVVLADGPGDAPVIGGVAEALAVADDVQVRLFGKPDMRARAAHGRRARGRRGCRGGA